MIAVLAILADGATDGVRRVAWVQLINGGNGLTGRYSIEAFHYREGFQDLSRIFGKAENLVVSARWAGSVFIVADTAVSLGSNWGRSEGESTLFRVTSTAVTTGIEVGTGAGLAYAGGKGGCAGGFAIGGPPGCAIGGIGGTILGGLAGLWVGDKVADAVYNYALEPISE